VDRILDGIPLKSEVIGCCDGDEKNKWPRRTDKVERKKEERKKSHFKNM